MKTLFALVRDAWKHGYRSPYWMAIYIRAQWPDPPGVWATIPLDDSELYRNASNDDA